MVPRQQHDYVVFGAGRQGTAAIHDLILHCAARRVLAVEPDGARRRLARARLEKLLGRRAKALAFAAAASDADLTAADALLSCAPYAANLALTKRALTLRRPFLDLGGNPAVVASQQRLAAQRSTPVVPECGVSPGLSNVLAAHLAREQGCDEVRVRCGGLPLERPDEARNPLLHKLLFSAAGLISEYSGDAPVIRAGRLRSVPALATIAPFEEGLECAPTSNNSPQAVQQLLELGVREYDYATVRFAGHFAQVRGWRALGCLQGDEQRDRELAQRLELDPALHYDPRRERDRLLLVVRGTGGVRGLRRVHELRLDVAADRRTRFSAMELTTAWGITIAAHHLVSGRGAPRGFATPERFLDGAWVLAEVERRLGTLRA